MQYIIIALLVFPAVATSQSLTDYKKKWGYNSLSCELSKISAITIKGKSIKGKLKKEKSRMKTIFTDLNTAKPKMVYPDQVDLIRLNKRGNTYWLMGAPALMATTIFIINTKENWFVQQRASSFSDQDGYFYTWAGRCE